MKAICIDDDRNLVWQDVKVMPITEAAQAHAILERGENRGKEVLTVG
jgi:NADPH:quinone reductase-like Zn-dependent oxidoreductase